MTLLEQGRNLAADTAMGLASVWNRLWVHCALNMPLTTRKRGGFTLELGTEIKCRETFTTSCFWVVVYNPSPHPFVACMAFFLFGKNFCIIFWIKKLLNCLDLLELFLYLLWLNDSFFNWMCSLPVRGEWICWKSCIHYKLWYFIIYKVLISSYKFGLVL